MAAKEGEVRSANGTNFDEMNLESGSVIDKADHEKGGVEEPDEIKFLLKNCYVPLDNGKNGLVFSADYTQRQPRYTCYVCTARMHGVKEFNMHTASQNHCSEMGKYKYPAKNFPILLGDLATQIELGEPAPPGMENEIQIKPCKIQSTLDSFRTLPLIGLEYLIELTDGRDVMAYCCLLCDNQKPHRTLSLQGFFCCEPNPHVILKHITSGPHSLKYLSLYFPRAHKAFETLPKSNDGTGIILTRVLKRIEGKFGRLKPRPFINRDFGSGKEALLRSIQEGFHFRESPDDGFDKLTKPDFETPAYKSSSIQEGSKEKVGENKTFNPVIYMKGRKFGLINTKSHNYGSKVNVPEEKLKTESPDKKDKGTENDARELENLSPVSGGSMGSMRGSRSRSNSPPRGGGDLRRSRSPVSRFRYGAGNRSRSPNSRRRSRSRNRSAIRSRSRDRSRTFNRSRSGNRSRSPHQHFRPRYTHGYKSRSRSRDRLNLPYRHKRSYSRSRSRSPRSFYRGRYNKFQPRRSPDEEQYKSDRFKEELRVLLDKLKYHEEFPEKHPKYSEEWKEFWNRRYKELQAAGKDPTKHDFKPEWISYWKERMLELHDQDALALKERIYNSVKEKNPEESHEVTDDDRNMPSKDPPGARMGFIPFSDDSAKVVAVLRLITVLESMLGVLAPQVVTLLSKALSMEKVKSDSSEDILYNENDCVLLETVKEKLKGLFFAGLVERHLVNTTKYTIKTLEEVLSKAPKSFKKRTNPLSTLVKSSNSTSSFPPPKQVTVSGIGTVDRAAIAQQIATTLISQGRTDVSEQELESLIDAVVASTSEEQAASPSTSQPQSQAQPSGALTLLQSAYDGGGDTLSGPSLPPDTNPAVLSKTLSLIESVDIIATLSDNDLLILVEHFNRLKPWNQSKIINYVKAVEKTDPIRFQRLQGFTPVNLNKLGAQAGIISPFPSMRDNSNPGGSNVGTMNNDNVDNYNYYWAASQQVGNDQMRPTQQPPPPYTNNAWWPNY